MKKIIPCALILCILMLGGFATMPRHVFTYNNELVSPETPFVIQHDKKYTNIVALVHQGSSRVTHKFIDYSIKGETITLNIERHTPFIQTMDFVSESICVTIPKSPRVTLVHVNVVERMEAGTLPYFDANPDT